MKKYLILTLLLIVLFPVFANASWWNPISWFGGWSFLPWTGSQIEFAQRPAVATTTTAANSEQSRIDDLENKINALEQKLSSTSTVQVKNNSVVAKQLATTSSTKVASPTYVQKSLFNSEAPLGIKQIISKLKPSVVFIETDNGSGSGMIIDGSHILTNAHVMAGVYIATIHFWNGKSTIARIQGRDEDNDVAVLSYSVSDKLYPVVLGDSDSVQQGDSIYAMGYPLGLAGDVDVKEGIISRVSTAGAYGLEISADILPGNSGGPLVDGSGNVIGIDYLAVGSAGSQLKFAIPINIAKNLLPKLENGLVVYGDNHVPLPNIQCSTNSSNVNGECRCDQGYAHTPAGACVWGADYCTVNFGLTYIYSDEQQACVCDTTRNILVNGHCVSKN